MINVIWLGMIIIGIISATVQGNIDVVTQAAIDYANTAVDIALGLIGVMTLWLGIMALAEKSGLVQVVGKALSPILRKLFPGVPEDHPAMGAMVMNLTANMLGLGNAATPLGIKAMQELDTLNEHKGVATDDMIMFISINTSSVTLIPATIIALRASTGSANPTEIIGPTIVATTFSTISAIVIVKIFGKFKGFQIKNSINK